MKPQTPVLKLIGMYACAFGIMAICSMCGLELVRYLKREAMSFEIPPDEFFLAP